MLEEDELLDEELDEPASELPLLSEELEEPEELEELDEEPEDEELELPRASLR